MDNFPVKDTTFDKIQKYYLNSGVLSDKELEICRRWELAFSILRNNKSKKIALRKYKAVLEREDKPISDVTAYSDFQSAEKIFSPLYKYTKDFLKLIIIESAMEDVRKAERLMKELSEAASNEKITIDIKAWSELQKVKDKAERRIIDAGGLMLSDPNIPDFSRLQMQQINITVNPQLVTLFKNMATNGVMNMNDLFIDPLDDVTD